MYLFFPSHKGRVGTQHGYCVLRVLPEDIQKTELADEKRCSYSVKKHVFMTNGVGVRWSNY